MELLNLLLAKPIITLILAYLAYIAYIFRQNKKMRKDLEQREIINEINEVQKKNSDLNLVDLVRISNERKLRRNETRPDNQKK